MALTRSFQYSHMLGGGSSPLISVPEAASQTYLADEILIASSGYAAIGAADPAVGTVIGLGTSAGHNTTAGAYDALIIPALPFVVFKGHLHHGTPASSVIAATDMFTSYGIAVTSNIWWVDKSDTTNLDVTVIGFEDAIGTLDGIVYFVFNSDTTVWNRAVS